MPDTDRLKGNATWLNIIRLPSLDTPASNAVYLGRRVAAIVAPPAAGGLLASLLATH